MFRKRILQIAQLSSVGVAGYYVGQYKGKANENESIVVHGKAVKNMPGLPIFGTVSAAAPYTDSGAPKDRVSFGKNHPL